MIICDRDEGLHVHEGGAVQIGVLVHRQMQLGWGSTRCED